MSKSKVITVVGVVLAAAGYAATRLAGLQMGGPEVIAIGTALAAFGDSLIKGGKPS